MKKGDRVLVKGYLENDEYTNKEGVVTKDVVINAVIFSKQERRTETSTNAAGDSVGF
jgi:single-stranded DNA-binding protein